MRVLLIDADSSIPNLALMKISAWHKDKGDSVDLIRLNMPYYPNKKKKEYHIPDTHDITYCSVIFEGNREYITGDAIFGGTGVSLDTNIPEQAEQYPPDYSLYPDNDTSYGFITRGCIRKCSFCVVPKKEGYIRKVADVSDIVQHSKVKFMDNNILAYSGHMDILNELADKGIMCCFNQGLDIRLLTYENSKALSRLKYLGDFVFAFDDFKSMGLIYKKLELLAWRKPWRIKFFVYVHPDMPLWEDAYRLLFLKDNNCLAYVMRDVSCWSSPLSEWYTDIACWANQPNLFKTMSFECFLDKRHLKNKARVAESLRLWREAVG